MMKTGNRKKIKIKFNWYFLAVGLIVLFVMLRRDNDDIKRNEIKSIEITLKTDLKVQKGRRAKFAYEFQTTNFKCEFVIPKAGGIAGGWSALEEIRSGNTIEVLILKSQLVDLGQSGKQVAIYGIKNQKKVYFDLDSFNYSANEYHVRIQVFALFVALMLLVNGVFRIKSKWNFIVIGVLLGTVILMRIYEFGLY